MKYRGKRIMYQELLRYIVPGTAKVTTEDKTNTVVIPTTYTSHIDYDHTGCDVIINGSKVVVTIPETGVTNALVDIMRSHDVREMMIIELLKQAETIEIACMNIMLYLQSGSQDAPANTPKQAFEYAKKYGGTDELREIASKSPKYALKYAYYVDRGPHNVTRAGASKDPAILKTYRECIKYTLWFK